MASSGPSGSATVREYLKHPFCPASWKLFLRSESMLEHVACSASRHAHVGAWLLHLASLPLLLSSLSFLLMQVTGSRVAGLLGVHLSFVLFFFRLEPVVSLAFAVLGTVSGHAVGYLNVSTALACLVTGLLLQLAGHVLFERALPAFKAIEALLFTPFYVVLRVLLALGYRPGLAELIRTVAVVYAAQDGYTGYGAGSAQPPSRAAPERPSGDAGTGPLDSSDSGLRRRQSGKASPAAAEKRRPVPKDEWESESEPEPEPKPAPAPAAEQKPAPAPEPAPKVGPKSPSTGPSSGGGDEGLDVIRRIAKAGGDVVMPPPGFLVLFDMDLTILTKHTGGCWIHPVAHLEELVVPIFVSVLPALLAAGTEVGIVTFSDEMMAHGRVGAVAGPPLVRKVLEFALRRRAREVGLGGLDESELEKATAAVLRQVRIACLYPDQRNAVMPEFKAKPLPKEKQWHVGEVLRQIRESGGQTFEFDRIVLFDDSPANVKAAQNDGMLAFGVNPQTALTPEVWQRACSTCEMMSS